MDRKHLSKTGEMLLNNHSPNSYTNTSYFSRPQPQFLDTFSNKVPSENELIAAQSSLTLLKSKMGGSTNGGRPGGFRRAQTNYSNFNEEKQSYKPQNQTGNNYRKVFKPNQKLKNLDRQEEMLKNNLGMLDDNLNMQKEIYDQKNANNNRFSRRNNNQQQPNRMGKAGRMQRFDDEDDHQMGAAPYNPQKYAGRDDRRYNTNPAQGQGGQKTRTRRNERRITENTNQQQQQQQQGQQNVYQPRNYQSGGGANKQGRRNPPPEDNPFAKKDKIGYDGQSGGGMGMGGMDPFAKRDKVKNDEFMGGDEMGMGRQPRGGNSTLASKNRRQQPSRRNPTSFNDEDMGRGGRGGQNKQRKSNIRQTGLGSNDRYGNDEDDYESTQQQNQYGSRPTNDRKRPSQNNKRQPQQGRRNPPSQPQNIQPDGDRGLETIHGNNANEILEQEAQMVASEPLYPCPEGCGRKFKKSSLLKHKKACKKIFQQKRKKFDMVAQKFGDNREVLQQAKQAKKQMMREKRNKQGEGGFPGNNKAKWKKQSEQLRAIMKANRKGGQEKLSTQEKKAISEAVNVERIPCPHCGRSFGQKPAEKHIPICAEKAKLAQMRGGNRRPTRTRRR